MEVMIQHIGAYYINVLTHVQFIVKCFGTNKCYSQVTHVPTITYLTNIEFR